MVGDKSQVNGEARRALRILAAAVLLLTLIVGVLASRSLGESGRTTREVHRNTDGNCQFWLDIASLPVTPQSGPVLLHIIADARVAYDTQGCASRHPVLPTPDPRISSYLPR